MVNTIVHDTVEEVEGPKNKCLRLCPECVKLNLKVGCDREKGHPYTPGLPAPSLHHCSNNHQGPHEW
jgi:hypothetical protein